MLSQKELLTRRKSRIRFKIRTIDSGRPRLIVHRTNMHIYAQVVDDQKGITLASASTVVKDVRAKLKNGGNKEAAVMVGKLVAQSAVKAGVKEVVFDRSGYLYHGRIKALADSARENGLVF